jgi:hypothetical protein
MHTGVSQSVFGKTQKKNETRHLRMLLAIVPKARTMQFRGAIPLSIWSSSFLQTTNGKVKARRRRISTHSFSVFPLSSYAKQSTPHETVNAIHNLTDTEVGCIKCPNLHGKHHCDAHARDSEGCFLLDDFSPLLRQMSRCFENAQSMPCLHPRILDYER